MKPAAWSAAVKGSARRASHLATSAPILTSVSSSRICRKRAGLSQERMPLSSSAKAIPPKGPLPLGVLAAIETDPRRVGKVGGELDE